MSYFDQIPKQGIVVDAMTAGNPGYSAYRGIDLSSGEIVFDVKLGYATNNIAEFIALVHGLMHKIKNDLEGSVYSDSVTAIAWVKRKQTNSSLKASKKTEKAIEYMTRCTDWLRSNNHEFKQEEDFDKWETIAWGENPADYGRK